MQVLKDRFQLNLNLDFLFEVLFVKLLIMDLNLNYEKGSLSYNQKSEVPQYNWTTNKQTYKHEQTKKPLLALQLLKLILFQSKE